MNTERSHGEQVGLRPPGGRPVGRPCRAAVEGGLVQPGARHRLGAGARCSLNRTTVWRLLSTLELHGLVERNPDTPRYHVGYEAIQIAAAADYDGLARRVRPMLERAAAARPGRA